MFQIMPSPIFNLDFTSHYQPAVPSPLSSSPLRPSQSSPLSPRDANSLPRRQINSSPIPQPKFKFASRTAKPNPLNQKREDAQDSRRKLFLKNVRQRTEDKQWERRGGDQEALKLEWSVLDRRWKQAKERDVDGVLREEEIDELAQLAQETGDSVEEADEMMVDAMEQQEQEELEASISMSQTHAPAQQEARSNSPTWSDDDDYDSLFMDFLSQPQQQRSDVALSGQMDMS